MAGNACAAVPASSQVDLPSGFPLCRKFCPVVKLPGSSRTQTNTHLHIRRPYLHQRLWRKREQLSENTSVENKVDLHAIPHVKVTITNLQLQPVRTVKTFLSHDPVAPGLTKTESHCLNIDFTNFLKSCKFIPVVNSKV